MAKSPGSLVRGRFIPNGFLGDVYFLVVWSIAYACVKRKYAIMK